MQQIHLRKYYDVINRIDPEKFIQYQPMLRKYYSSWYRLCHDHAKECLTLNKIDLAQDYLNRAKLYFDVINEHWKEIE